MSVAVDFEAIREAHDLLSFVPADAQLRKVGPDRWRGRCPIGDHAAGAFSVVRERGVLRFNCFACGVRGDVVDFVAALDGITPAEARRRLARGAREVTPDERLARQADAWKAVLPWAVLACDECPASVPVRDWAELAARRDDGWRLSASGRRAACPAHGFVQPKPAAKAA